MSKIHLYIFGQRGCSSQPNRINGSANPYDVTCQVCLKSKAYAAYLEGWKQAMQRAQQQISSTIAPLFNLIAVSDSNWQCQKVEPEDKKAVWRDYNLIKDGDFVPPHSHLQMLLQGRGWVMTRGPTFCKGPKMIDSGVFLTVLVDDIIRDALSVVARLEECAVNCAPEE